MSRSVDTLGFAVALELCIRMKIYEVECGSIRVCDEFLKWKWLSILPLNLVANLPQRVWRGPLLAMDSENSAYEKLLSQCKSNGELTSCLISFVAPNRP